MGICPSTDSSAREIKQKNSQLTALMLDELKDLRMYMFYNPLIKSIGNLPARHLYNEGIIEDIDKLAALANNINRSSVDPIVGSGIINSALEQQIKNSSLILENQVNSNVQQMESNELFQQVETSRSFQDNLSRNQSLIEQMYIIYGKEINKQQYELSLKLFLKWVQYFNEHSYGGFLKPIYRTFCQSLLQIEKSEFQTIVDEISIFVQYMVKIYTMIYNLKELNASANGKLIKNENIYNLIISFMFRKTNINSFIKSIIKFNNQEKIQKFEQKLKQYRKNNMTDFGIHKKFILLKASHEDKFKKLQHKNFKDERQSEQQRRSIPGQKIQPSCYESSLRLVSQVSSSYNTSSTPISKLKILVSLSRQIIKQISEFYINQLGITENIPQLDPDNLSSIIMYLIVKNNNPQIYEQLKIIQNFTTTNSLNCISGYYLNTFVAACEMIIKGI